MAAACCRLASPVLLQRGGHRRESQQRNDAEGHGDAFHEAMFHAYFVDGRNIADIETLVPLAASVGLFPDEARAVITERRFQAAVDADWQRSRDYGITGVPTFVANGRGVVGAQPYEILERLVVTAGGTPRKQG